MVQLNVAPVDTPGSRPRWFLLLWTLLGPAAMHTIGHAGAGPRHGYARTARSTAVACRGDDAHRACRAHGQRECESI
jgi:hypothetical protein